MTNPDHTERARLRYMTSECQYMTYRRANDRRNYGLPPSKLPDGVKRIPFDIAAYLRAFWDPL